MRLSLPSHKKYLLLNGEIGWQAYRAPPSNKGAESLPFDMEAEHIVLPASEDGPFVVKETAAGSLGGLTMPHGTAISPDLIVFIAVYEQKKWLIKRFCPAVGDFQALPDGHMQDYGGGRPSICILGRTLYIGDPKNDRLLTFGLDDHQLGVVELALPPLEQEEGLGQIKPGILDVGVLEGRLVLLAQSGYSIWALRLTLGRGEVSLLAKTSPKKIKAIRLAIDLSNRIWLQCGSKLNCLIPRRKGQWRQLTPETSEAWHFRQFEIKDINRIRHLFRPVAIQFFGAHPNEVFYLPESMAFDCNRKMPEASCLPQTPDSYFVKDLGDAIRRDQALGTSSEEVAVRARLFDKNGIQCLSKCLSVNSTNFNATAIWYSEALDSHISQCEWHRIIIALDSLPASSAMEVYSYASDEKIDFEAEGSPSILEPYWQKLRDISDRNNPSPHMQGQEIETLFNVQRGRYLYLKISFDGQQTHAVSVNETPVISSIRLDFPREAYANLLPAVFKSEDSLLPSNYFLPRFLSIIEAEWDQLERKLDQRASYFLPQGNYGKKWSSYLSAWLGFELPENISAATARALLRGVSKAQGKRGTLSALKTMLSAVLGRETKHSLMGFPVLVEGFRERRRASRVEVAGAETQGVLGSLSGQEFLGKPENTGVQIGVTSTVGVSVIQKKVGAPHDIFDQYAHRLKIYVPAVWLDSDTKTLFEHVVKAELPAHVSPSLETVYARSRIGFQSTCGIDTILSQKPRAWSTPAGDDTPMPPWRDYGYGVVAQHRQHVNHTESGIGHKNRINHANSHEGNRR